jgi:hypothetical protein
MKNHYGSYKQANINNNTINRQESIYRFYWLIEYLLFYFQLENISLICRRHYCRWRAAKFRPLLGAYGVWAGRDLVTWGGGLIFLLSHPKERPIQSPLSTCKGMLRIYSNTDPHELRIHYTNVCKTFRRANFFKTLVVSSLGYSSHE